ncbi:MAG: 2-oxopent-4-enoate hydratase, partial [Pseudomonadales bacterium]
MDDSRLIELAEELYQSYLDQSTIEPLTEREADITIEDAYRISEHFLNSRLANDGEVLVGKKIGVTSKPVQDMLGVYQPDFGFLTNTMEYTTGASVTIAGNLIQPRAEAEIAFRLKKDLIGPGITEADVLDATKTIIPCFEIVDSRIDDWKIKIQDTVADNASCGVYVLSDTEVDPRDYD